MNKLLKFQMLLIFLLLVLVSCTSDEPKKPDLVNHVFSDAQTEIRGVINSTVNDAMSANIEGLRNSYLNSDKFTKFGSRSFERQNVKSTNESEAEFFSCISNLNLEIIDLKINVFDKVGIANY